MLPGLPTRLEREIKQLYFDRVAKGNIKEYLVTIMYIQLA